MTTKKTEDTTEEVVKEAAPKKRAPAKKPAEKAAKPKKEASADAVEVASIEREELADQVASNAADGGSWIPAVGRRKTSIARVRLIKNGKGAITVNGKKMEDYFTTYDLREQVSQPLKISGQENAVDVSVLVQGGGIRGQAEAARHGISRALIVLNPTFRKALKKLGYLTRDARKRERKKFGLKGARRAPQWSKR